jgi:hypothetical protein
MEVAEHEAAVAEGAPKRDREGKPISLGAMSAETGVAVRRRGPPRAKAALDGEEKTQAGEHRSESIRSQDESQTDRSGWVLAKDIHHIYATNEFERQVYARFASGESVLERKSSFVLNKDAENLEKLFLQSIPHPPNIKWAGKAEAKSKPNHEDGSGAKTGSVIECDLYLRIGNKNTSEVTVKSLFADAIDAFKPIVGTDTDVWTAPLCVGQLVLCEVAETPQSMRSKVFQLLRAVLCGPFDVRQPRPLCVVCVNGEQEKFDLCAEQLKGSVGGSCWPGDLPLAVIWTQYRSVYGEIKMLRSEFKSLDTKVDTLDTKVDTLDTKVEEMTREMREIKNQMTEILEIKNQMTKIMGFSREKR